MAQSCRCLPNTERRLKGIRMPVPPLPEGLIVHSGSHRPAETADRLVAALTKRGITVLARIDHAADYEHQWRSMPSEAESLEPLCG